MKRGLVLALLLVLGIGVVSAYSSSYGYSGGYGFGGFYLDDYISGDFISYSIIFLIFLWLLQTILKRVPLFQEGKTASIGALLLSAGITYGLYRSSWNLDRLIYSIGLPDGITSLILMAILLVAIFFAVKNFGLRGLFLFSGAVLIGISFTDLVYDTASVAVIGFVLFGIGAWLWRKHSRGGNNENNGNGGGANDGGVGQRMDNLAERRAQRERDRELGERMDNLTERVRRAREGS